MAINNTDAFVDVLGKAGKEFSGLVSNALGGKAANGSNKWINNAFGGAEYAGQIMKNGGDFKGAFNKTFREGGEEAGKVDYAKIAMSYAGVAGTGRVLSGGGVYKDSNGNTNLAVVPFV